jgi:maspardin
VFFNQLLALSTRGHRVLAVEAPVYWTHLEWCRGFRDLLDLLGLEKVHILGAALGGFLAQKFVEFTRACPRVASIVLCNSFTDTTIFRHEEESGAFWLMPAVLLRGLVMRGLEVTGFPAIHLFIHLYIRPSIYTSTR